MSARWMPRYAKLTEFLGLVLGPDYEIVLHDLQDPERSIVAIANGHVSGRTTGAPLTSVTLQAIVNHSHETSDYRLNYAGIAKDNKLLRSSTFFIRDEAATLVGLLCINFDDSRYRDVSERILKLRHPDIFVDINFAYNDALVAIETVPASAEAERLHNSPQELMQNMLAQTVLAQHKHAADKLPPRKKFALITELEAKGFFRVKGAVKQIADRLGCSQTTIYRYLTRITEEKNDANG
jgi:predicted transcriptional regulator YheO